MLLEIHPVVPQARLVTRMVEILNKDGVIVYPTDTSYALGCSIFSKKAIQKIYRMKEFPKNKALSIVCHNIKDISRWAVISDTAYRNMRRLMPGPYTFVLPATRELPKTVADKRKEVGIRIPDNSICQALVEELGHPLLSAGAGWEDVLDSATIPYLIHDDLGNQIECVIDGGVLANEHSTVVRMIDDDIEVLREGKGAVDFLSA